MTPALQQRFLPHPFAWLFFAITLAACGAPTAQPTVQPTRPPVTPTAQPVTASPMASSAAILQDALARTGDLERYRMSFNIGGTVRQADGSLQNNPIIGFSGDFVGQDVAFRQSADPARPGAIQEVVIVAGTTYARGALPLAGIDPLAWYELDSATAATLRPGLSLAPLLERLTARVDLAAFAPAGGSTEPGQPCTRYVAGLSAALGALDGLGRPTTAEAAAAEATPVVARMEAQGFRFSEAEAVIVVCPDGLLRRFESRFTVQSPDSPDQLSSTELILIVDEPNGALVVTAPEGALSLDDAVAPQRAFAITGGTLYAEPDSATLPIAELPAPMLLSVLAQSADGSWYEVRTADGETGWIEAKQVSFPPDVTPTIPVKP